MLKKIMAAVIITSLLSVHTSWAAVDNDALLKRLQDLEQEVATLKSQIKPSGDAKDGAEDAPIVTAKRGFSIKTPDDAFQLKIQGIIQADTRTYLGNRKDLTGQTDNFLMRRVRPIFEGTLGKKYNFMIVPDFASSSASTALLIDAYIDFKVFSKMKIRGGKFKSPIGLERLRSATVDNFNEKGLPANLVPNRDVGFQIFGDVLDDRVNYALGVFNGGNDLASNDVADTNNDKDLVGRMFAHPFKNNGPKSLKGLGVGIAGSFGHREGTTLNSYKSQGQSTIFSYSSGVVNDGAHTRLSPQAYFYKGAGGVLAEYVASRHELSRNAGVHDRFINSAWQISGSYTLTGEAASFKGIKPKTSFDLKKRTWGAFEVVGRYGQLKLDPNIFNNGFSSLTTSVSAARAWGLGLNWYPSNNVRFLLSFEQTHFDNGATSTHDRPTENVIFSRMQLTF